MSYTARDLGHVIADPGPYVAMAISPGAVAAYVLGTDGALQSTRAGPLSLSSIEPGLPTLSLGNNAYTAHVLVQDDLGVETGTLICAYDTSGPSGSCLVSWQPVAGVVTFIQKVFSADEMIGPAMSSGGLVYWPEFDWTVTPSPAFNVTVKRAKGDLTTSLATVASWGINSADLDPGASGYALDGPFEAKILVAAKIQVVLHLFEQSGGGDIWYWWRFSKGGALEARQTIAQADYDRFPTLGHDAGIGQPLGAANDFSGLSLQKNNDDDPANDESHWPTTGSWVSNIWRYASISPDETEAMLYFDFSRRLIRDVVSGSYGSEPRTDLTVALSPTFDVLAFRG